MMILISNKYVEPVEQNEQFFQKEQNDKNWISWTEEQVDYNEIVKQNEQFKPTKHRAGWIQIYQ